MLLRAIALAFCSLSAAGCVASVRFDPVGSAATVEGAWLLDGAAPSSESCAARSITHVRVRFFEPDDPEVFRDHPDLVFPCEDGSFDTRPQAVLASGAWSSTLLALDANAPLGEELIVAMGPDVESSTTSGHVVLPPVDF
jgi:hypothetical protein